MKKLSLRAFRRSRRFKATTSPATSRVLRKRTVLAGSILSLLPVLTTLMGTMKTEAASLYWEPNPGAPNGSNAFGNLGGPGTWDTITPNWWDGMSLSNVPWSNTALDTAVFAGPAGTVTLASPITVGGLQFNTTGYTVTASVANPLSFGAANTALTLNNVAAATVTGPVGGTGGVVLSGGVFGGVTTGTFTFNGVSTSGWSGATTINNGMTMALAASSQALLNTSGITLNNGAITLTNTTSAEGALDRVSNAAPITVNGGAITYTNTAGAINYAETLGAVTVNSGRLAITSTNATNTGSTEVLTLGGLTQTGSATVAFSGGGGLNTTVNQIVVSGATATPAGQIIGPWATVGTAANAQTDYAVYNAAGNVLPANITAVTTDATWTAAHALTSNYTLSGATTTTATRNINSLRYTGAAASLTIGTGFNLNTYGVLNAGSGVLTITGGTGLSTPTGGGNLYLTTGNNQGITVASPVLDNGGAVAVVVSGTSTVVLSATTSNYSGGTVVNSGTLSIGNNANLGAANGGLTFNGTAGLTFTAATPLASTRAVTLNNGSVVTVATGNFANSIAGNITGTGGFNIAGGNTLTFSGTGNTYTGPTQVSGTTLKAGAANAFGTDSAVTLVNVANTNLDITGFNTAIGSLSGGGTTGGNVQLGGNTLTVGNNNENTTFGGAIAGAASTSELTKVGTGILTLTGTSTFTGAVNLNGGTVNFSAPASLGAGNTINFNGGTLQYGLNNTADISTRTLNFNTPVATIDTNGNNVTFANSIGGNAATLLMKRGLGTLTLTAANTYTGGTTVAQGVLNVQNSNGLGTTPGAVTVSQGATLQVQNNVTLTPAVTLGGAGAPSQTGALVNVSGNNTLSGPIALTGSTTISVDAGSLALTNATGITGSGANLTLTGSGTGTLAAGLQTGTGGLIKNGTGTWTLTGANTNTGATTINAGTLVADLSANPTGVLGATAPLNLAGGNLTVRGAATGASTQTLGNLTLSPATNSILAIDPNNGTGTTVTLGGTVNRGAGSTLVFDYTSANAGARTYAVSGPVSGTGAPTGANNIFGYALVKDATGTGLARVDGANNISRFDDTTAATLDAASNSATTDFTTLNTVYTGGVLNWTDGGALTNRAVNSLTFDTTNTGGIVNMGAPSNLLTVSSGALLFRGPNNGTLQGGRVTSVGGELFVHQLGSGLFTIASAIPTGSLIKDGSGTLLLSGANTFSGPLRINEGVVRGSGSTAFGNDAAVVIANTAGTGLELNGTNQSIGSLAGGGALGGNVALGSGRLTVGGDNTATTFGGTITGAGGSLTKVGTGSLALTNNASTFSGEVVINNGALVVSGQGALGTGTTPISINGIANTGNPGFSGGQLVVQGGTTGATFTREISILGRGPQAANASGSLVSIGNNTFGDITIGSGAAETRISSVVGTATVNGLVNLATSASSVFYGNGNFFLNGRVTGFENAIDRLVKTGNTITTTLTLANANNTFLQNVRIDSGTVRVATGTALGQNTLAAAIDLNGGTLEVRADANTGFSTRNINLRANSGIVVSRAVDGLAINQTITFGNFAAQTSNTTLTYTGRDGYNLTQGTGTTVALTTGNPYTFANNLNGTLTFNNSLSFNDATGRVLTLGGNAEYVITGNLLSPAGGNHIWSKTGTGTLVIQGTAGTFTGSFNSTGTTQVTNINALSNNVTTGGGAIQLNAGSLDYRGTGQDSTKLLNLSGTTAAGIILANQPAGSTALRFQGNPVGAGGAGSKTLFLGGASDPSIVNEIGGVINNNTAANITSLAKVGTNTWLYSPAAGTYATAPTGITSAAANSGTNTNLLAVSSTTGLAVGMAVSGTNVPGGSVIESIVDATNIRISNNISTAVAASTALTFTGNANFTGNVTIGGGTLQVRPSAASGSGADVINNTSQIIFNNDPLTLNGFAGGTFEYQGSATAGTLTEAVGALTPTAGTGVIKTTANGGVPTLSLGSYTARTLGAVVNFQPGTGTGIQFAAVPTAVLNGLVTGAYITNPATGAIDFVATPAANTNVTALNAATALPAATGSSTTNYVNSANLTTTAAVAANSVRVVGSGQTITLGGALTLTTTSATAAGGLLFDNSAGAATITGSNIAASNVAGDLIFITGGATPANALTINSTIGAGAAAIFTKAGTGTLILGGNNTFTGNVHLNEGTVVLSGATAALGAPAAGTVANLRQNTILDLNGAGAGGVITLGALNGAGTITNSGGGTNAASTLAIGTAATTGVGVFSGVIQDGAGGGMMNVTKSGTSASTQALTGLNTYTGVTTIAGGSTLIANRLANGGVASSIGASSNAAGNLIFNNGVLQYTGSTAAIYQTTQTPSVSIDRLFTLTGSGTLDSSGTYGNSILATGVANNAALIFNNTGAVGYTTAGARSLTLTGSSTGDNEIDLKLVDNTNGGAALSVTKAGGAGSLWILGNAANTYSGPTTINAGTLRAQDGAGLSPNSNLVFGGGVLETAGTFTRSLGAGAGQVQWASGTAAGGFAASTGKLTVAIGGVATPATLNFGTAPFTSGAFILGSATSQFETEVINPINLGGGNRSIQVDANATTSVAQTQATLSGVISNGSLSKTGAGALILSGANTYTGNTNLTNGSLFVSSLGNAAGTASSNLGASGGTLALGSGANVVNLLYTGAGETSNRPIALVGSTGTVTIDSSGSGGLTLANITNVATGVFTLSLRGTNTDQSMITAQLTNSGANALAVSKADGGIWVLNPAVANTFTGNLTAGGGTLGLTANGIGSAASLILTNGAIAAFGGPLTTSVPVTLGNNSSAVFAGANNITINNNITKASGANDQTFSNNLENGAVLTINGNLINLEGTANATRTINVRGMGSTVWNGSIQDNTSVTTNIIRMNYAMANNATFTLTGAANTNTGGTVLGQGTLILNKATALGATAGNFVFNGGVIQAGAGDLTGANKITNKVQLQGDPATVSGANNIELGGIVELNNNRLLLNNLDTGKTLTISGNVTNITAASALNIAGSGNTVITGNVTTGAFVQSLAYSGTGTLTLNGNNDYTGSTTVNRGLVVLSGTGTNGQLTATSGITLFPTGTLRLDNSGGNTTPGGRIPGRPVTLQGGTLDIIGAPGGTTEVAGALTVNTIESAITMSGGNTSLTFASANFANSGSTLNLTGIPSLGTNNKVLFTTSTGLNVSNGVVTRALIGDDFASYNATNGIVAFTAYNNGNNLDTAAVTDTLNVTASTGLTANRTINALKISGAGLTIGTAGRTLTLSSGGLLNAGGANTLAGTVGHGANSVFQINGASSLDLTGSIVSPNSLGKAGSGTMTLSAPQFYLSTTNVLEGTLRLNAGLNTIFPSSQALNIDAGGTLDLNGNTQYVGVLGNAFTAPAVSGNPGTLTSSTGTGTFVTNMTGSATFGGRITGANVNFGRVGGNTLTFEIPQTYGGQTVLMGGITTLQDDATLLNTPGIDLNYATLFLSNNSGLQTANANRLSDTAPIALRGGTLQFTGRVTDNASETVGPITAAQGANTLTVSSAGLGSGAIAMADFTAASLTRLSGTTVNFTSANVLGAPGNNARINFTTPLVTAPNGALGAWAIANSTDYAAYNAVNGIGSVGTGGYAGYDLAFAPGNITNVGGDSLVAVTNTLPSGGATTGLLRLAGGFQNDLLFANAGDVLNLELGGILRSNNNNPANIGSAATRGVITTGGAAASGNTELIVYNAANTLTINSVIANSGLGTATTSFVKSGAGTAALSAPNTYSGGTIVNQGTLNLAGGAGTVVIPAGGLTINGGVQGAGAAVTMVTNAGQIDPSNAVTINGRGTLTLVGNNTLSSVVFNNNGGEGAPTVATGGVLTLTSNAPVTVTSSNAAVLPVISGGGLALASGTNTFNVGAIQLAGGTYTNIQPALNISAPITGPGSSIVKTGAGLLQMSGASTFSGFDLQAGGVVLGTSSSPAQGGGVAVSGPLGIGSVSVANGTRILVDNASRTLANNVTFAGSPIFDNTGTTLSTLTLNGQLTFANGPLTVQIPTPYLNVALLGRIMNVASIPSITKTGLGNLFFNADGFTGTINFQNLGTLSLLADGDGYGTPNTIPVGALNFDAGIVPTLTIGRAGGLLPLNQAANKTLAPASFAAIANGINLTANNGYGLLVSEDLTLVAGANFNVAPATVSNVVQGLTLSGVLSGANVASGAVAITKSGAGTLVLANPANTFGGTGAIIDITGGVLQTSNDGALGDAGNVVRLNVNATTGAGFRAAGTFSSPRTFTLNQAQNGFEVTQGNVLTLTSAFGLGAVGNALFKNDNGVLQLSAANPTWTGGISINAGAVRLANNTAAGTGTILVAPSATATGAALQLAGVSIGNTINLQGTGNQAQGGINFGGQLQSLVGTNTTTGQVQVNNDAVIGADAGSTLNINGGIHNTTTSGKALIFNANGTINVNSALTAATATANQYFAMRKFGSGALNFTTAQTIIPTDTGTGFQVLAGTLGLSGAGTITGGNTVPAILDVGSTVNLNNSGVAGNNVNNRLGGRPVTFRGTSFNLIGNDTAVTTETLGAPTFARGLTTITVTAQPTGQANLLFSAASNAVANAQNSGTPPSGASVLFRGTGLGGAAANGVATIQDTAANGFVFNGQTGATGTTNKAILPWALIDPSATGSGVSFATGDAAAAATGTAAILRPLNTSTEMVTNALTANTNVRLTAPTTAAAGVTLNSLTLESGGALNLNPLIAFNLSSGGILAKAGNAGINGGVLNQTNTLSPLNIWTVGDLNLTSTLNGGNGVTNGNIGFVKAGAGMLTLSTPTSTLPGLAGLSVNTMSGQYVVNQGTVKLNGGTNTIMANNFLAFNGGTIDLNGNSQYFLSIFGDNAVAGAGGTFVNTAGTQATLVNSQDNAARNFAGSITGNIFYNRAGQNTLNLFAPQTYTGGTLLNGGTTVLRDDAALVNTPGIEINYAALSADNNAGIKDLANRINDAAPITFRGGTLTIQGRVQTASAETIGALTADQGFSVLNAAVGGTNINSIDVTATSLSRTAGSSATFMAQGTNLGLIGSNSRIHLATVPALTNNLIGAWAITNGNEFATYIPGLGIASMGQVGAANYDGTAIPAGNFADKNIRIGATSAVPAGGSTINVLSMGGAINLTFTNATDTLNLTSGGLIGPNNNQTLGATVDSGRLTAGGLTPAANSDLYVYNRTNTFTINSRIVDNTNGGGSAVRAILTANGGTITLANSLNSYTGGTVVNGGTLNLSGTGAGTIPLAADPTRGLVISNATVTMNNAPGQIALGNLVTLTGNAVLNLFGDNTVTGFIFNNVGGNGNPTVNSFFSGTVTGTTPFPGANGVLTVGSGGVTASSSNVGTTNLMLGRTDFGTSLNTITVNPIIVNGVEVAPLQATLDIRGVVGSSGGINKEGTGVLTLNAQQIMTGKVNVNNGTLMIGTFNAGSRFSEIALNGPTTKLNLNGQSTTIGALSGDGIIFNSGGAATLSVGYNNQDTTFSGQLARFNDAVVNAVFLNKIGTGTLSMTSAQAFGTGTTGTISVSGGTLVYRGLGTAFPATSVAASTITVNSGGTLLLDNAGTNLANRLGLNAAGTLNLSGGEIIITGNANTNTTEQVANLTNINGGGFLTLQPNAARQLGLTVTALTAQNATGTAVYRGLSGTAANGNATLTITTPNLITGQGTGANGTTTMPVRTDILGDASPTGLGTGFLVRDSASTFYRPLAANELQTDSALWAATQNAGLNSAVTSGVTRVMNTLTASGTGSFSSALPAAMGVYGTNAGLLALQVDRSGILALNGAITTINTPITSGVTGTTFVVHTVGNSVLNANSYFAAGSTGGLAKADGGTLNLNAQALYTGSTTLNGGTLNLNSGLDNTIVVNPTATTPTVSALQVNGTSTLDLRNRSQAFGSLSSNNAFPGLAGTITNSGGDDTVTLTSAATGGTTFAGQINGALSFTRSGNNTTTLTGVSTYTGATTVRGGVLQLRDGGSILNSSAFNLNYGTLLIDQYGLNPLTDLNPARISATAPINMQGASLNFNAAGSVDSTITLGTVTSTAGQNTINVLPMVNQGSTAKITIANLVRTAGSQSIVNFNGFTANTNTLGLQGLGANGNIILTQVNGSAFSAANLNDGLIGGWAVANGNTFATYKDGFGVIEMGTNSQGVVFPPFSAITDINGATTAADNVSDLNTGTRTITANKVANSWRLVPAATTTWTLGAGVGVGLDVGIITNTASTITLAGTDATSTLTGTGSDLYVYLNQGTMNLNTKIIGGMNFVKGGGGTLTFNPAFSNSYTGNSVFQGGTTNLSAGAGIVVIPGNLVVNNATVTMNTNAGQIASTSNVTLGGSGVLNMVGTNTLASVTFNNTGGNATPTLAAATLTLSGTNAITSVNDSFSFTPTISGAGLSLSASAPVISTSGLSPNSLIISVPITSAGGVVTKTGAGSVVLSGASTFTNGFTLNQGSVIFGAASTGTPVTSGPVGTGTFTIGDGTTVLSDGTARTIANAVTVNGDFTFGGMLAGNNLTLSGATNLGANGRTITVASPLVTGTLSGAVTSTATGTAITKAGPGTLLLSNAGNNFGGAGVNVTGGILKLGVAGAMPITSPLNVSAGAGFDLGNLDQTLQQISGSGFITNSGATARTLIVGGSTATDNTVGFNNTFDGVITNAAGALALTKAGTGTLTLTNANSYTGLTTVNVGTLSISNSNALGTTAAGTAVASGASLELQGGITVPAEALTIIGAGFGGTGALRNLGGNNTYGGTVTLGAGGATIQSDAGLLTLSAANSVTSTGQNLIVQGAGDTTISGTVTTGAGSVTKNGAGVLSLFGNNTFTGGTTVNAGTVRINSDTSLGAVATPAVINAGTVQSTVNLTSARNYTLGAATSTLAVDAGTTHSLTGTISGSGTLNKGGTGTLALTGTNSYTGGTVINAGTLTANTLANGGTNSAIGSSTNAASNLVINDGAIFRYTGAATSTDRLFTVGAGMVGAVLDASGTGAVNFTNTGDVALGGLAADPHTLTLTGTSTLAVNNTLASKLTGNLSLIKEGTNTWILTNNNDFTGNTVINGGRLQLGNGGLTGSLSGTNLVTINSGGALAFNRSDDLTFGSQIIGVGGVENRGPGGLVLSNPNNTYSGATIIGSGAEITVTADGALGVSPAGTIVESGGTLRLGTNYTTSEALTLSGTGRNAAGALALASGVTTASFAGPITITGGGATIKPTTDVPAATGSLTLTGGIDTTNATTTFQGAGNVIIGGAITGTNGNLAVDGSNVTLNTAATYTGSTLVQNSGAIVSGVNNALPTTTTLTIGTDGTFDLGGNNQTLAGLTDTGAGTRTVTNNGAATGTLTVTGTSAFGGTIQDGSALTALVVGGTNPVFTLTGANTYTGGTTVNTGATLRIGNGGSTGSITGNVANSGTLSFNRADTVTFAGNVTGPGTLVQAGPGTLVATGALAPASTTILGGTLQVGDGGTIGSISGNVANSGTLAFNRTDTITYGGDVTGGTLVQAGSGTLIATGALAPVNTNINAGILQVGNGGASGTLSGNVLNNSTLAFNRSGSVTYAGTITGSGQLLQQGPGTLVLTGANNSTGLTDIQAGTLELHGSISGNIHVDNGATFDVTNLVNSTYNVGATRMLENEGSVSGSLTVEGTASGTGTMTGSLTANNGGTIAPGVGGIGTLTTQGSLNMNPGSNLNIQLAGTPLNISDLLVASSVSLSNSGAGVTLNLSLLPSSALEGNGSVFFIVSNTGGSAVTGSFANATTSMSFGDSFNGETFNVLTGGPTGGDGSQFAISYDANILAGTPHGGNDIALIAVPEPSTAMSLLLGLGALTGLQRFRRRRG